MLSEPVVYFLIRHMSLFMKSNSRGDDEIKQPTHVDYKKNLPSTHPAYITRMLASSTGWIKIKSVTAVSSRGHNSPFGAGIIFFKILAHPVYKR